MSQSHSKPTNASPLDRVWKHVTPIDFLAALLIILTVTVQASAIWMAAGPLQEVDKPAPVETNENSASSGVGLLTLMLLEAGVLVGLYLIIKRLPEFIKRWLARIALVGAIVYAIFYALVIMPMLLILYAVVVLFWVEGYQWLAFDIMAVTISIVVAATLGGYFGPIPVTLLLLGLLVYDWIAVTKSSLMARLVQITARVRFPAFVVIPKRLDFDLTAFCDRLATREGDDIKDLEDETVMVIGAGDFALPAALTASVFRFYGVAAALLILIGTVVGTLLLRSEFNRVDHALPGLPWLAGGAVFAYAFVWGLYAI